ncbi:MAG: DUF4062 domain-containing protein [Myxococcales bacterium FL481]|nr:MAG: DUF4062 domain-containing protein [Myxococcales bacterium FL481]
MLRPRVYISSAFFDLELVRDEVDRLVRSLGYEAVHDERRHTADPTDAARDPSTYSDIDGCDIVVGIVGGRYSMKPQPGDGEAFAQQALQRCVENDMSAYFFVQRDVLTEHEIYKINHDRDIQYRYAGHRKIHEFIESIYRRSKSNPITPFDSATDITNSLRRQWSGLFQRLLRGRARAPEQREMADVAATATTLREAAENLNKERRQTDDALRALLLLNHPAFEAFAAATGAGSRVFFTSRDELNRWLADLGYEGSFRFDEEAVAGWEHKTRGTIELRKQIFNDLGQLEVIPEDHWQDGWVVRVDPRTDTDEVRNDDNLAF